MHKYQQMVKHRANCELKLDLLYQRYLAENKLRDVTRHFQQNKSVDYDQISRVVETSREYALKVKQYRLVRLLRLKQRGGLACQLLERQAVVPMQLKQLKAEKQMLMRLEKVQMKSELLKVASYDELTERCNQLPQLRKFLIDDLFSLKQRYLEYYHASAPMVPRKMQAISERLNQMKDDVKREQRRMLSIHQAQLVRAFKMKKIEKEILLPYLLLKLQKKKLRNIVKRLKGKKALLEVGRM